MIIDIHTYNFASLKTLKEQAYHDALHQGWTNIDLKQIEDELAKRRTKRDAKRTIPKAP